MNRRNNGFTLVEVIITMSLLAIIMAIAFSLLSFGNKSFKKGNSVYDDQSAIRLALEQTNKIVRYSSAIFAIPKSSFGKENPTLTPGWSYLGVRDVVITPASGSSPAVMGSELVRYVYDTASGKHVREVVLAAQPDIFYKLVFKKKNPEETDKLLLMTVESYSPKKLDDYGRYIYEVIAETELEALNALQIVDWGTAQDPAAAIAYRSEERPDTLEQKKVEGHIAMVLDTSGSMDWKMDGNTTSDNTIKRLTYLKAAAKDLINSFGANTDAIDIEISLVPFATSANNPKTFKNPRVQTELTQLRSDIDSLTAYGGTNTGDGLRRAYWNLKNNSAADGASLLNYIIVLVDGVTTYASYNHSAKQYITQNGEINESKDIIGSGNQLDSYGTEYVDRIGDMITLGDYAKVYVIGFSAKSSELASLNDIATACDAAGTYTATNYDELKSIFKGIQEDISDDLWFLTGPDLK